MRTYAERKADEIHNAMMSGPGHPSLHALAEQLVADVLEDASRLIENEIGDVRSVTDLLRSMAGKVAEIPAALERPGASSELAWWRSAFATRFPPGDLPKPGTALIARRFRLVDVRYDGARRRSRGHPLRLPRPRGMNAQHHRRHARHRRNQQARVWAKTGGICWLCDLPVPLKGMSMDHITPKSNGGQATFENLMPSHKRCNGCRGDSVPPPCALEWLRRLRGEIEDDRIELQKRDEERSSG